MLMSIILFIVVLSVLVLVHELGHFLAAKRAGLLVEEFGFGIPPRVFGKKFGETIYSINLLPFGGFVRVHGETSSEGIKHPKRAFLNQSKTTRAKIIVAGVLMNFLLAIFSFAIVYTFSGIPRQTDQVKVVEVVEGSPADRVGIEKDDIIYEIDGLIVSDNETFISSLSENLDQETELVVMKADSSQTETYLVTPRSDPPEGEGALGVIISSSEIYYPPVWQRPFIGVYFGFKEAIFWTGLIVGGFIGIIAGLFRGIVPSDIAGPVGIYAMTSQAAEFGILPLINFVGILSVNLMILNILPFPALDGGRLLFVLLESFLGRKVLPKLENAIHAIGMALLIILLLVITFADIKRLITAGGVDGFLDQLVK